MFRFYPADFLKTDEISLRLERTKPADPQKNYFPAYYFAICNPQGEPMGKCDLRIGYDDNLYYGGHIGYTVEPAWRGHHYAAKACRLLFSLAKLHDMPYLYITCNPDNHASRKTCEYLGAAFVECAELPADNPMRVQDGETHKLIYRVDLQK